MHTFMIGLFHLIYHCQGSSILYIVAQVLSFYFSELQ